MASSEAGIRSASRGRTRRERRVPARIFSCGIRGFAASSSFPSCFHPYRLASLRAGLRRCPTAVQPTATTTTWSALVTITPPDPPKLNKQLDYVAGYADLRADRAVEITAQMAVPYGFWASVVPLYAARHRYTYELLHLVVQLAKHAEMNFKNAFATLRPHELSPQIQPMIPTPNHGSFPERPCDRGVHRRACAVSPRRQIPGGGVFGCSGPTERATDAPGH